jgi:SAM-dependent methyltransferase
MQLMQHDWDNRARENARYFIATGEVNWTDEDFFASGERTVRDYILGDMVDICQGKSPDQMRVLEIGCGAGRVTRALARLFGEVHTVDVSAEMVRQARLALDQCPNAKVYQNNGMDLSVIPALPFDFAFSSLVFHHIPSYRIIENYVRETHRLLVPGGLFKFQVRGNTVQKSYANDTWVGIPLSDQQAVSCAKNVSSKHGTVKARVPRGSGCGSSRRVSEPGAHSTANLPRHSMVDSASRIFGPNERI